MTCKYPITSRSYKFCLGCSDIDCCEDAVTSNIPMPEVQPPKNVIPSASEANKLTFLGCGGEIVKYNIKTVRTLVTDNKKNFRVGEDIAFTLFNKVTNHHDHYIGNIVEMTDTSIKISNIEIDRYREDGEMIIDLENIESNSCNYVYCD